MWNNGNDKLQARGFSTPPPPQGKWGRWSPPLRKPLSEKKPQAPKTDLFHVIHKVPAGDSPYVRAKHVQLIEKDPSKAISLFWAAINSGDRVDSALKDMAVVMKQLDRSDEAIEAIKSFRHLCPLESQDSLDNVLVELYKRSDRIEDQIEMLQRKVKAIEEGMAFGGKRSKSARSQGKKFQITIEQEYSRLLGNLAWAYLQQDNFKSAEELYRKALSFEADKNKQCNLAICLMHMDRMIEAKLLLQTIQASPVDGQSDDSYLKSYERATQVLIELESKSGVRNEKEKLSFGHGNFSYESSPQTLFVDAWNKGFHSENSYERKVRFGSKKNDKCVSNGVIEPGSFNKKAYYSSPVPGIGIPKVPFTQPRCSSSFSHGSQQRVLWRDFGVGACSRKLSFEQQMRDQCFDGQMPAFTKGGSKSALQKSEIGSPSVNGNWRKTIVEGDLDRNCGKNDTHDSLAREGEVFSNGDGDQKTSIFTANCVRTTETVDTNGFMMNNSGNSGNNHGPIGWTPTRTSKKSWADIVEEDERQLLEFGDENVNTTNISHVTPLNEIEKLSQKIESMDLGYGYYTQPQIAASSMNRTTRRSLCFDHQQPSSCPLALNFEGSDSSLQLNEREGLPGNGTKLLRRNRLQVFRDITVSSESPRP